MLYLEVTIGLLHCLCSLVECFPILFVVFCIACLSVTDWRSSLLESKWHEFKNAFIKLSNGHAPIQCRRLKNKSNPWFDAAILAMIYRRDRSQRNAVTRVIRQRKRNRPFPPTFATQREREKRRYWLGFFGVLSSPLKTAFGTIGNCRLRSH